MDATYDNRMTHEDRMILESGFAAELARQFEAAADAAASGVLPGRAARSRRRAVIGRPLLILLVAAAAAAAAAAVYALVFLWPGVPGTRTAVPPRAVALVRVNVPRVVSWAPHGEVNFFFQDDRVYWAVEPVSGRGVRIFVYDAATGAVDRQRRLEKALAGYEVSELVIGGKYVSALTWKVFWGASEGEDGFRGLLAETLLVGEMSSGELTTFGADSLALIGNGGLFSRTALQATPEVVVWFDWRNKVGELPPEGSERLPEVTSGRDRGVWVHAYATGRTYRLPGYPEINRHEADMPALSGHFAYWPSTRRPNRSGPIVAFDLRSKARTIVPTSDSAATLGEPWQDSVAADESVVVWTACGDSGATLKGWDMRREESLPAVSASAVVSHPAVDDDFVVWIDHRRGSKAWDVYGLDLKTGEEFLIAQDQIPKTDLSIDGTNVYWTSDERELASGGIQVTLYGVSLHREAEGVRVENLTPAVR